MRNLQRAPALNVMQPKESMSKIQLITIGAILVAVMGAMTMIAGLPKLYSPYSFTVVIPALLASGLNLPSPIIRVACVLPLLMLFIGWSFVFVKPPFRITHTQKLIAGLLIVLSVVFNVSSFSYGLKYQGELHTYLMYTYNALLLLGLSLVLWRNTKNPSIYSCVGFGVLLFAWLGWVAFPWLGELI
jgi:hypothetical protein